MGYLCSNNSLGKANRTGSGGRAANTSGTGNNGKGIESGDPKHAGNVTLGTGLAAVVLSNNKWVTSLSSTVATDVGRNVSKFGPGCFGLLAPLRTDNALPSFSSAPPYIGFILGPGREERAGDGAAGGTGTTMGDTGGCSEDPVPSVAGDNPTVVVGDNGSAGTGVPGVAGRCAVMLLLCDMSCLDEDDSKAGEVTDGVVTAVESTS